jgi:hypothetical protein
MFFWYAIKTNSMRDDKQTQQAVYEICNIEIASIAVDQI